MECLAHSYRLKVGQFSLFGHYKHLTTVVVSELAGLLTDETDSGFDLGHSRSPTEGDDHATRSFPESVTRNSDGEASKSYTPIFKKKKDTPLARKKPLSQTSSIADEYMARGHHQTSRADSSDEGDPMNLSSIVPSHV